MVNEQPVKLHRMQRLARVLDTQFTIPGTKIPVGFDFILGLIPGVGDWVTSLLGGFIVIEAYRDGVSRWTTARMLFNLLVDSLFGSLPIVGDIFDIFWRANVRNMSLWSRSKRVPITPRRRDTVFMIFVGAVVIGLITLTVWGAVSIVLAVLETLQ